MMLTPTDSRRAPCSVFMGFVGEVTSSWVGDDSSAFSSGFIFSSLMVVGVEKRSEFRSVVGEGNLERTPGGGKRAGHAAVLNPWPPGLVNFDQAHATKENNGQSSLAGAQDASWLASLAGGWIGGKGRPPTGANEAACH